MTQDQDPIRDAIRRRLFELNWSQADLARESTVNANTVTAILKYGRWPKDDTREKLEMALGWPAGRIEALRDNPDAIGQTGESLSVDSQELDVLLVSVRADATSGLSDLDRDELETVAREAIMRRARELRERSSGEKRG